MDTSERLTATHAAPATSSVGNAASLLPVAVAAAGAAPTAAELLAGFFARYRGSTLRTYRSKLAVFAQWLGVPVGELPVVLLERGRAQTHLTVLAYRAWLRDDRRLAASTINGHLAAVHAVVAFLREAGLCEWTLRVRYERARGYRDTRGPGLPAVRRLLAAAAASDRPAKVARDTAALRLLVDLGLRRGELVELDVGHVEGAVEGRPTAVHVRGKGHADRERLTLPAKTADALAAWLVEHPLLTGRAGVTWPAAGAGEEARSPEHQAAPQGGSRAQSVPLFTALDPGVGRAGRGGQRRAADARLTGLAIAKLLEALARRAGLRTAVRPHGIRHTAITALLDAGLALRDVQRFSRHSDVRTLAIYDDNRTDIAGRLAVTVSELV